MIPGQHARPDGTGRGAPLGVPARLLTLPERRPGRLIAAVGLAFAIAYGASLVLLPKRGGRLVVGDAVHYYVHLRSVVFDGDVNFQNEYLRLYNLTPSDKGGIEWLEPLPTGHVRNVMPVGTAITWAPLYLMTTAAVWVASVAGFSYPLDGYGWVFQATAGFSGIAAATGGAWFAYRAAATVFGPRVAIWATLAFWLSSSALYYSMVSPTYSHASSMLSTGLLAWCWMRAAAREDLWKYVQLGALVGLCALVRWQDATMLLIPALEAAFALRAIPGSAWAKSRGWLVRVAAACATALVVFTPQLAVWAQIYGRALVLPQGEGFMRWTEPALVAVLLSDYHGLFSWTPIAALAVAGVVPLWRLNRRLGLVTVVILITAWYVNAAVADWWAGEAFGSRRFLSCFPFLVLALAAALRRFESRPARLAGIVGTLIILNALLLFQYQLFLKGWRDIAPYPRGGYNLWLARFVVPFRAVARLLGS